MSGRRRLIWMMPGRLLRVWLWLMVIPLICLVGVWCMTRRVMGGIGRVAAGFGPYSGGDLGDPATLVSDASRFYGNRAHADADALVTDWQWAAAEAPEDTPPVSPDDPVVLGFDGSRHRKKGVTDATVLIAQRVSDGFSWPVGIWEQPDTAAGRDWEPPEYEIEQTLDQFMGSHHVVGFYADPSLWESNVASWEAKYGDRLKIGPKSHRIAWRTNQLSRVAQGVELLMNNILTGELVHDEVPL